jgi:hypothetical protein
LSKEGVISSFRLPVENSEVGASGVKVATYSSINHLIRVITSLSFSSFSTYFVEEEEEGEESNNPN